MTPGKFDLSLYRGDSYAWRFILWQDEAQTVPVDLTGATVEAEIREKSAGTSVVALTCTPSLPNTVDVAMTPDLYATCPSKGVWDLQVTFPDGSVQTPVAGTVTVSGDVTDSVAMPVAARER
jgi:hypothetical protein